MAEPSRSWRTSRPTLVLLPGLDGTGDLFVPLVAALDPSIKVQIIGYPDREELGYRELEQHVRARLPATPFVLLGESFAGPLAISIAASRPPGLVALALCCTFARNPRPAFAPLKVLTDQWFMRHLPTKLTTAFAQPLLYNLSADAPLKALLTSTLQTVSAAIVMRRLQEVLLVNVVPHLRNLKLPVLYLQATQDRLVPNAAAMLIARELPPMKLVRLDGPHGLLQVSPQPAARALEAFISATSDALAAADTANP